MKYGGELNLDMIIMALKDERHCVYIISLNFSLGLRVFSELHPYIYHSQSFCSWHVKMLHRPHPAAAVTVTQEEKTLDISAIEIFSQGGARGICLSHILSTGLPL